MLTNMNAPITINHAKRVVPRTRKHALGNSTAENHRFQRGKQGDRTGQVHIGSGDERGPLIRGRQRGKISQLTLVRVLC